MSAQLDWVGAPAFIDPRFCGPKRRRLAVHEQKERLRQELRELTAIAPRWLGNAGVETTRTWVKAQKAGLKLVDSDRASVQQLQSAINALQRGPQ